MKVWKPKSSYAAKGDGDWATLLAEVASLPSLAAVREFRERFTLERLRDLPDAWQEPLWAACDEREASIRADASHRRFDRAFSDRMANDRA